ncbi:DUF4145 domain-containing protein [Mesorhizobium sp. M0030]|uniref:DUF4145 domain-containing protein n=1 Tax=Mesorhizobium sp. M0030 TaxID=2956851 RepID=UPI003339468D
MKKLAEALGVPTLFFRKFLQTQARCPHCSIPNPGFEQWWVSHGLVERGTPGPRHKWGVYFCTACGGGILAKGKAGDADEKAGIIELIPAPKSVHEDVPEPARTFLRQAMETLHAPDAAAVMAGASVDAMLKTLTYEKGSVYERIEKAVAEHKLTEGMGAWAHEVRLGSNRPRHADKENPHVSEAEAKQSVEFAEALAYFLFILTKRIERGKLAAEEASNPRDTGPEDAVQPRTSEGFL